MKTASNETNGGSRVRICGFNGFRAPKEPASDTNFQRKELSITSLLTDSESLHPRESDDIKIKLEIFRPSDIQTDRPKIEESYILLCTLGC